MKSIKIGIINFTKQEERNIFYPWDPRRVSVYMLTVFGDESHDEKEQRIFAVAGIMGTQEEWDRLTPIWNDRLKEHPWNHQIEEPSFHAADCDADQEDFKGILREKNRELYKDLVTILVKANLIGFGVIMDLVAYRQYFPDYIANSPYQRCFHRAITWFVIQSHFFQPQQKVRFIFHCNSENDYSSAELYHYTKKLLDWEYAQQLFDDIGFVSRKSVGIQAADILAREGMKYFDNFFISLSGRPIRTSMRVLGETQKYFFSFITKNDFETYKSHSETEEWQKTFEDFKNGYERWLLQKGLTNNIPNRNKYLLDSTKDGKESSDLWRQSESLG